MDNSHLIVHSINEQKAKQELKKCPKIVRDYVNALQNLLEIRKNTVNKAIKKIRELSKN